jgi:hypothetical protein
MARWLLRPAVVVAVMAAATLLLASAQVARAESPAAGDAPEYRNHTVGGADGWFFDATANATSGNYSGWANGETFYLGDYLSTSLFLLGALSPSLPFQFRCLSALCTSIVQNSVSDWNILPLLKN